MTSLDLRYNKTVSTRDKIDDKHKSDLRVPPLLVTKAKPLEIKKKRGRIKGVGIHIHEYVKVSSVLLMQQVEVHKQMMNITLTKERGC